jgi:hypothetical protein
MQWGITPSANTGTFVVVFPVAFPNACDAAFCQMSGNASTTQINSISTTGVTFLCTASGGNVMYWHAIGH